MARIQKECPYCIKNKKEVSHTEAAGYRLIKFECGHTTTEKLIDSGTDYHFLDSSYAYPFQQENLSAAEKSGLRILIADEMGLGKTISSLLVLKNHPEAFPVMIVCKSSLTQNWFQEIIRKLGPTFLPQIISDSNAKPYPIFRIWIVSYDLLRRCSWVEDEAFKPKTLILDECQHIKTTGSSRTRYTRSLAKKSDHIIALSGTPIKNRALEYWPVLNMLRPEIFPSEEGFARQYLVRYRDAYGTGPSRLRNPESFKELTSEFIIRHERKDVLPDLPKVRRQYHYSDLGDSVKGQYAYALKEFNDAYDKASGNMGKLGEDNILAKMAKLRHLTGLAKVEPCIDFLVDFLDQTDRKIVVFLHHRDVAERLQERLGGLGAEYASLTAAMDGTEKYNLLEKMRMNGTRVLVSSTLSGGEGLNMQFMSDCMILERQWNPSNEEQAEGRFTRIWEKSWGEDPGFKSVTCNYQVAVGTIDEILAELVERKRHMFKETMSGKRSEESWNEGQLMKELADILREKGGKRFGLNQ